jgi:hypothetical protein
VVADLVLKSMPGLLAVGLMLGMAPLVLVVERTLNQAAGRVVQLTL